MITRDIHPIAGQGGQTERYLRGDHRSPDSRVCLAAISAAVGGMSSA